MLITHMLMAGKTSMTTMVSTSDRPWGERTAGGAYQEWLYWLSSEGMD
jgi:hypothetical protein